MIIAQASGTPGSVGPHGQVTLQWRSAIQVPLSAALILSSLLLKLLRVRMCGAGFSLSLSVCCGLHYAPANSFVHALTPSMTIFSLRVFKEIIKVK